MRLFLSYASQDRAQVEPIRQALAAQGHDIFFDREDLPAGESFDDRIRDAIERSDLFIAVLSPDTVDAGSYTLNEVDMAARKWPNASGRVLSVLLRPMDLATLPAYLKSVTLLQTEGHLPAAVVDAVHRLADIRRNRVMKKTAVVAAVLVVVVVGSWFAWKHFADSPLTGRDGAPAVAIPAGNVVLGDDEYTPVRSVYLDAFYIDKFEVTVARYARFLEATGGVQPPDYWDEVDLARDGEKAVIGVTWREADSYCQWARRRLPTAAEWEYAARGTDERRYPWGKDWPTETRANSERIAADMPYEHGLAPVGSLPAGISPFGVMDMAGNAAEFVADWASESFPTDEVRNPKGPAEGTDKVIKGGGWYGRADSLLSARNMFAGMDYRGDDTGFRCATSPR
jgi:formylglycine-generating enzyme required for sulfatase activity